MSGTRLIFRLYMTYLDTSSKMVRLFSTSTVTVAAGAVLPAIAQARLNDDANKFTGKYLGMALWSPQYAENEEEQSFIWHPFAYLARHAAYYFDFTSYVAPHTEDIATTLPVASNYYRGRKLLLLGGAGVADVFYICRKNAADAYEWAPLS